MEQKIKRGDYITYSEGAKKYSVSIQTFRRMAAKAEAVYKQNHHSLVNVKQFEKFLELFKVGDVMPSNQDIMREIMKRNNSVWVRYDEGAWLYSMSRNMFMKLAADAGALYKIYGVTLINTLILDYHLESFRI